MLVRQATFISHYITCQPQNLYFACSNTNENLKNSVCKVLQIHIKYTYPYIQKILFCEIEGVIRFSLSRSSQLGNQPYLSMKKLITTTISKGFTWRLVYDQVLQLAKDLWEQNSQKLHECRCCNQKIEFDAKHVMQWEMKAAYLRGVAGHEQLMLKPPNVDLRGVVGLC